MKMLRFIEQNGIVMRDGKQPIMWVKFIFQKALRNIYDSEEYTVFGVIGAQAPTVGVRNSSGMWCERREER